MAATSDRDVMTQLTSTNKELVQTIHQLTEQLGKAQAELAQAKQQQVPKQKSNTNNKPTPHHGARPKFDHAAWKLTLDPDGYCWSHGYRVVCGHNSADCKDKQDGHQDAATRANPMGGSDRYKP
jgi:hypothetical protein